MNNHYTSDQDLGIGFEWSASSLSFPFALWEEKEVHNELFSHVFRRNVSKPSLWKEKETVKNELSPNLPLVFNEQKRRKRRKVDVSFFGLVDLTMPLWIDLFSVIFLFLTDQDLHKLLTVSKQMLEVVKSRAVFRIRSLFITKDFLSWRKCEEFYFSSIEIRFDFDVDAEETLQDILYARADESDINVRHDEFIEERRINPILRQRFLSSLCISAENGGDMRVFSRRNESGNLLFPHLKTIELCKGSLEQFYFWDFLREFPKRFSFNYILGECLQKEHFKRMSENAKFDVLDISRGLDSLRRLPEVDLLPLRELDARSLLITLVAEVPKVLKENKNISGVVLKDYDFNYVDVYVEEQLSGFVNLQEFEVQCIPFSVDVKSSRRAVFSMKEAAKHIAKMKRLKKYVVIATTEENIGGGFLSEEQINEVEKFCSDGKWTFKIRNWYCSSSGRFSHALTLLKQDC